MASVSSRITSLAIILLLNPGLQSFNGFKLKYDQQKALNSPVPSIQPSGIKEVRCQFPTKNGSAKDKNNLVLRFGGPTETVASSKTPSSSCYTYPPVGAIMSGDLGLHISDYLVLQGEIEDGKHSDLMECRITVCKTSNDVSSNDNGINSSSGIKDRNRIHTRSVRDVGDLDGNELSSESGDESSSYNSKNFPLAPLYYPMRSGASYHEKRGLNPLAIYLIRGKKGLFYVMPHMKMSKEKGIMEGELNDKRAPPQGFWGSRG